MGNHCGCCETSQGLFVISKASGVWHQTNCILFTPHLLSAHDLRPVRKQPFRLNVRKHWLNILAICATVLGLSTTIYFIFYTNNSQDTRPPIVFGQNYDSDTCKLTVIELRGSFGEKFKGRCEKGIKFMNFPLIFLRFWHFKFFFPKSTSKIFHFDLLSVLL